MLSFELVEIWNEGAEKGSVLGADPFTDLDPPRRDGAFATRNRRKFPNCIRFDTG